MSQARVLVIGAGVGGVSAALWLRDLNIPFRWIEARDRIGGTLLRVGNAVDELPFLAPTDGASLVAILQQRIEAIGLQPEFNTRVTALLRHKGESRIRAHFSDGQTLPYEAVVLATGTQPRLLGLPFEEELMGRGVELSVTRNRERYAQKKVAIVGGGDAALEGALLLRPYADEIHIVHRRSSFRAQKRFVDEIYASPQIQLHLEREIHEILPDATQSRLQGVRLDNEQLLPLDGLFVRLGVAPAYPKGAFPHDTRVVRPYLQDDPEGRGPLQGTYVVGDVCTAEHQSVAWATGSASRAILTLSRDLGFRSTAMTLSASDGDT